MPLRDIFVKLVTNRCYFAKEIYVVKCYEVMRWVWF